MDLFDAVTDKNLLPFEGEVRWYGHCFSQEACLTIYDTLLHTIDWKHETLKMFAKTIQTKRKVAWYGEPGLQYSYSNTVKHTSPWTAELLLLKHKIEELTKQSFNSCLLNLYHDGEEGMGWHSDNEPELGTKPVIASLSFGASRKFQFRHNKTKKQISLMLNNGTLLLMKGETQTHWKHQVPKMKAVRTARINLTFRTIVTKKS